MYWRVAHMCNTSYVLLSCVASRFHLCFAFLTLSFDFSSTPDLFIVVFYTFFWHSSVPFLFSLSCLVMSVAPFTLLSSLFLLLPVLSFSIFFATLSCFLYFHAYWFDARVLFSCPYALGFLCLYLTVFRKLWPHEYVCWQLQDVPLCVCVFTDRVNVCILGTHDSVAVALSATWGPSGSVLISVEAQNGFCLVSQRSHTPAAATFSKAAFRDNRA